jgi:predicted dehydrogenase
MAELGAVVVGTGFGCLTHVRALREAGFDVQGLVGRDRERTAQRARRFDIPYAATSLSDALKRPGVDVVTIATPPDTHSPLVLEAVEAGRHVLCEKPFAMTTAEAEAMLEVAERQGVVHLLGTEFRFAAGQALLRRTVAEGAIGQPRLATFMLHMPLLAGPGAEVPEWWSDARRGGGWLGAHAVHVVDQIRSTLGEISDVSAGLSLVADRPWSAEDSYTVHFRTVTGVEGVMQSSAGSYGDILVAARVAGSHGTCWLQGDTVFLADAGGTRELEVPEDLRTLPPDPPPPDLLVTTYDWMHSTGVDMGPYIRLFETFGDLIRGRPLPRDPQPGTFADGVASMTVLDAVRRSAIEHVQVHLNVTEREAARATDHDSS